MSANNEKQENSEKQEDTGKDRFPSRWKKGQSGNPAGKPKKALVTNATKEILESPFPARLIPKGHALELEIRDMVKKKATYAQVMALTQVLQALKGDTSAFNAIANRTEGMPGQKIQLEATIKEEYNFEKMEDDKLRNIINLQDMTKNESDQGATSQTG